MIFPTMMKRYCGAALLVFFYASTVFAAELPGDRVGDDAVSLRTDTEKASSSESLDGVTIEYFKGYSADYKSDVTAPTIGNQSDGAAADCLNKYCIDKETVTVPLYTSSKEYSWGLTSLHDGFSLNLQTAMRNFGVILQHKF
ncbi:MAG TPA: hypothetical protein VEI57_09080 [Nitrospirota bacterium]|nr:hypothetical protein [Nitrospirota bacterium]